MVEVTELKQNQPGCWFWLPQNSPLSAPGYSPWVIDVGPLSQIWLVFQPALMLNK